MMGTRIVPVMLPAGMTRFALVMAVYLGLAPVETAVPSWVLYVSSMSLGLGTDRVTVKRALFASPGLPSVMGLPWALTVLPFASTRTASPMATLGPLESMTVPVPVAFKSVALVGLLRLTKNV